jgi:uncharacterized protein YbjT (DUF2867 family)
MRIAIAGATGLIGAQVVRLARAAGHEVVELSRSRGVDLTEEGSLDGRLDGVEALVDVTRSPSMETDAATAFFTTVAANLGRAAHAAGVGRTVVLSIVGAEQSQDYGWYAATTAHEHATRAVAPGARVLRATQFHEFPGQILQRSLSGRHASVVDWPSQPVDSAEVARQLLTMALEDGTDIVEIAGPRRERVADLVRRLLALRGEDIEVEAVPAPASMAGGSVLPGPSALIRGPDWDTWARARL